MYLSGFSSSSLQMGFSNRGHTMKTLVKYIAVWLVVTAVMFFLSWMGWLGFSMAYVIATGQITVLGTLGFDAFFAALVTAIIFVTRN